MLCAPRLILNGNTGDRYNNSLDSRFIDGSNIYRGAKRLKAAYKTYEEEITKKEMKAFQIIFIMIMKIFILGLLILLLQDSHL